MCHWTARQWPSTPCRPPPIAGAEQAHARELLTRISALSGIMLFASAGFSVLAMAGTLFAGKRQARALIVWAESLGEPARGYCDSIWDRLGLWFAVAVGLVLIAYAIPLWDLLHMTRYGSPGSSRSELPSRRGSQEVVHIDLVGRVHDRVAGDQPPDPGGEQSRVGAAGEHPVHRHRVWGSWAARRSAPTAWMSVAPVEMMSSTSTGARSRYAESRC